MIESKICATTAKNRSSLAAKVVGHHALADTRAARHLGDRGPVEPELDDRVDRAVDELIAPLALGERGRPGLGVLFSTHDIKLVRAY